MLEVVFLGTGAFMPTDYRAAISTAVRGGRRTYVIDCGEGFLSQLRASGLHLGLSPRFFFSHDHADHLLGLGGYVHSLSLSNRQDKIEIYASAKTLNKLQTIIGTLDLRDRPSISWGVISNGWTYEDALLTCRAFPTSHTADSCGFVLEEKPKRSFDVSRATALGIPPGTQRSRLARGERVTLEDGRVIDPEDVLGASRRGAKLVFVTDAAFSPDLGKEMEGADCAVIEGTYLARDGELATKNRHLTVQQAALLGLESNARRVVINHLSSRYRASEALAEARSVHPAAEIAEDLTRIEVDGREQ